MSLILVGAALAGSVVVLDHLEAPAEQTWIEELTLAMPPGLVRTEVPPAAFDDAALHEQLSVVRPMLGTQGVGALAWLHLDDDAVYLSVAFVEANRAVVRVVDVPDDGDAPGRLALAAREILAGPLDLPAVPERAPPAPAVERGPRLALLGGATLPVVSGSGGTRAGFDIELTTPLTSAWSIGGSAGLQANGHHWRVVPRGLVRWKGVFAGLSADVTRLEWVTWIQPRLEVGSTLDLWIDLPVVVEPRLRISPVRDRVEAAPDQRLYDSGWVEVGVHVGLARTLRKRPAGR